MKTNVHERRVRAAFIVLHLGVIERGSAAWFRRELALRGIERSTATIRRWLRHERAMPVEAVQVLEDLESTALATIADLKRSIG